MRFLRRLLVAAALVPLAGTALAEGSDTEADRVERARELFQRYVDLEQSYDPALVELYADDAVVQTVKRLPNGATQAFPIPIHQYKRLVIEAMKIARERGDKQVYSQVEYVPEGTGVRVNAVRYSFPKESRYRVSILFGPTPSGEWRILEESTLAEPARETEDEGR